jgi:hypothetical protein
MEGQGQEGTAVAPENQPGTSPEEGAVTVDGLQNSLDDLVKAADATDVISKGNGSGIEHSGRVDESGKGGGGRATASDAGGLDKMMVAKLSEAGFDLDTISSFNDYLVGKAKKKDDEEEEEEVEGTEKGGTPEGEDELVKSMDEFRADPDINNAVDVSPYLEAMTLKVAEQIDGMRKSIADSHGDQRTVNRAMAAAVHQVGTLLKSQSEVIDTLRERLGIVEKTPLPAKGKTDLSGAKPLEKSMPGEAGGGNGSELSKAETTAVLSYMNLEKGITNIGSVKTADAIYRLEGGNILDPAVGQAIQGWLASNPNEAEVARRYQ